MYDFVVAAGVPPAVIRLEEDSTSTRENALFTSRMLADEPGCRTLLTSDFHMYRAYRSFVKAGLEVTPAPLPDARKRAARWHGRWPAFLDLVKESAKILYYFARGWI